MTTLGPLYHWAPQYVRDLIEAEGLAAHGELVTSTERALAVCTSADPHTAWERSGALHPMMDWDLWQIALADTDEVHILPQWGAGIVEVRVHSHIPVERVTWIGERNAERG